MALSQPGTPLRCLVEGPSRALEFSFSGSDTQAPAHKWGVTHPARVGKGRVPFVRKLGRRRWQGDLSACSPALRSVRDTTAWLLCPGEGRGTEVRETCREAWASSSGMKGPDASGGVPLSVCNHLSQVSALAHGVACASRSHRETSPGELAPGVGVPSQPSRPQFPLAPCSALSLGSP